MQSKTLSNDMHLNSFLSWKLDPRVSSLVEDTCFKHFLRIKEGQYKTSTSLLTALVEFYCPKESVFIFGENKNLKVDFGLQDILYITGLPIDGKQVSGYESNKPEDTISENLGISRADAKTLFKYKKCAKSFLISPSLLRDKFEKVPKEEMDLEPYLKAYLLYLLATVLIPNKTQAISPMYLPLLGIHEVNKYAWGAAILTFLKSSLITAKDNSSLSCFSYALMVFALERFPCLRIGLSLDPMPSGFPLFLGWMDALSNAYKDTYNVITPIEFKELLTEMKEEEIIWQPYKSWVRDDLQLPNEYSSHLKMIFSHTPCICFNMVNYNRRDLCFKQLGLTRKEVIKSGLKKRKINNKKLSRNKDKDWKTYSPYYAARNNEWGDRYKFLVSKTYMNDTVVLMDESDHQSQDGRDHEGTQDGSPTPTTQTWMSDHSTYHSALTSYPWMNEDDNNEVNQSIHGP